MYVFDAAVNNAQFVTVPRLDGFKLDVPGVPAWLFGHFHQAYCFAAECQVSDGIASC